jgi:hypothetical protein
LASVDGSLVLIRMASGGDKHCCQGKQRQSSKSGKRAHFTLQLDRMLLER